MFEVWERVSWASSRGHCTDSRSCSTATLFVASKTSVLAKTKAISKRLWTENVQQGSGWCGGTETSWESREDSWGGEVDSVDAELQWVLKCAVFWHTWLVQPSYWWSWVCRHRVLEFSFFCKPSCALLVILSWFSCALCVVFSWYWHNFSWQLCRFLCDSHVASVIE